MILSSLKINKFWVLSPELVPFWGRTGKSKGAQLHCKYCLNMVIKKVISIFIFKNIKRFYFVSSKWNALIFFIHYPQMTCQ